MARPRERLLIVANWKMNLGGTAAEQLARDVAAGSSSSDSRVDVAVAPPFPWLERVVVAVAGSKVAVAAQDMHWEEAGAYTGAVSAAMLTDAGARYVLVGHSERRHVFGDDDAAVRRKLEAARGAGLTPLLCVGEQLSERDAGRALEVVTRQLDAALAPSGDLGTWRPVVAYEPVWAIGTGRVAGAEQAAEIHAAIHAHLGDEVRVLYGGSVTPDNAAELCGEPEIDGLLVGGASLDSSSFLKIVAAGAARTP